MLPQALEPQAVELQQALVVQVLEEQAEMEPLKARQVVKEPLKAQEVVKEPLKAQEVVKPLKVQQVVKEPLKVMEPLAVPVAMIWVTWELIILVVVDDLTMDFSVLESQFLTWLL